MGLTMAHLFAEMVVGPAEPSDYLTDALIVVLFIVVAAALAAYVRRWKK
jgi:hypothetical protein